MKMTLQLIQSPLELTHTFATAPEQIVEGIVMKRRFQSRTERLQESASSLMVRSIHTTNKTTQETRRQFFPLLRQHSRMTVRRNDNLPAVLNHLHNRVQELFLSRSFVVQEFDVIDQQDVHVSKLLPERWHRSATERCCEVVRKRFTGQIHYVLRRKTPANLGIDRFQKMRFSGSRRPVNEQRVVSLARTGGDLL